ncbi:MAG TPA: hypothetical protein PKD20_02970 [Candidatus Saccharibacteria bacterium]|jgi:hypothetical protein|nr:hypothetical protein [Candidatus Saccharibacteria bacterium]HMT55812.1 hypothetical protein [Candidatus Saccharibacteria bacterium]
MDFANRGNRPVQQQPAPMMGSSDNSTPSFSAPEKKGDKKKIDLTKAGSIVVLIGVALVALLMIIALAFGGGDTDTKNKEGEQINADKYQAVFLDSQDGQVYFGKLNIYNSDMYVLTDIYYVRVENPVQPEGQNQQQQANISLAKLGNELHGPEDSMFIRRDKVLFWENLKDDGQVVKAITEYKKNGGNTNNTTTDTTNSSKSSSDSSTSTEQTTTDTSTPTDTTTTQQP